MEQQTFERLIAVGRSLAAELDLDALLQQLLDVARDLTGAKYAAVGVLDERRERLERFLTAGIPPEAHSRIGDLPRGRGVLGLLIQEPRPLRMPDVSRHAESYGFPLDHPPMGSFLGVPIIVGGQAWGNLYLTEKRSGGEFAEEDEDAMVVLADWAAIAIANARLYRHVRQRRDELERAVRTLETTTEIARAIGGEIDLDRILELVAKRGRALVTARAVVVALAEGEEWRLAAMAGEVAPHGAETVALHGRAMNALVSGHSERIDRLGEVGRLPAIGVEGAESALVVPLVHQGRPIGGILAFDRLDDGPAFNADDERLLEAFAASASTAVATAQQSASQALERSIQASERERRRWARELHDETLQELAGLRLLLSAARRSDDADTMRAAMDESVERISEGIANLRSLITDLRPASLDELGAAAALEALADRVRRQSGLTVELEVELASEAGEAQARYVAAVEETIYRVVQEALTNIVKHAQATTARVYVSDMAGDAEHIVIRIADDGVGFTPSDDRQGFGLTGMQERIALVGGTLSVEAAPGKGAVVQAVLPQQRREDGAEAPGPSAVASG